MPSAYSPETVRAAAAMMVAKMRVAKQANATKQPWTPQPGAQALALNSNADELFYGGAAGGGKTDLLIGAAVTRHHKSIIFRREYPQLTDVITRSQEILMDWPGKYNDGKHRWKLWEGKTLEFGSMPQEKSKFKYQVRPHDLKAYDELPQFTLGQYKFTSGWNRSVIPNQRKRVIGAGNPPGTPEGEWVIEYWAPWLDDTHNNPAMPGELRWYATVDDKDQEVADGTPFDFKGLRITPRSRTFIPASLADNPILAATGYASVVMGLPEPLRSQLLFGDFRIRPDADVWQVIPTAWVEAAQKRWIQRGGVQTGISRITLDVARGGKDRTVSAVLYTDYVDELITEPGSDTPDGFASAKVAVRALGLDPDRFHPNDLHGRAARIPINVDIIGPGVASYDVLVDAGFQAYGVFGNGASEATDRTGKLQMLNLRAEMYWNLREALDPLYGSTLCLPPGRELLVELTAARWSPTVRGVQIMDKEKIKEKLGRSPDLADAVAMLFLDMAEITQNVPTSTSTRRFSDSADNRPPSGSMYSRRNQKSPSRTPERYGPVATERTDRPDVPTEYQGGRAKVVPVIMPDGSTRYIPEENL